MRMRCNRTMNPQSGLGRNHLASLWRQKREIKIEDYNYHIKRGVNEYVEINLSTDMKKGLPV